MGEVPRPGTIALPGAGDQPGVPWEVGMEVREKKQTWPFGRVIFPRCEFSCEVSELGHGHPLKPLRAGSLLQREQSLVQTHGRLFANTTHCAYPLITVLVTNPRSLHGSKNYPACTHPGPAPMGSGAISFGNEVVGANWCNWCNCVDVVGLVQLSLAKAG